MTIRTTTPRPDSQPEQPTAAEETLTALAAAKWVVDVIWSSSRRPGECWYAIAYLKRPVGALLVCRATDNSYERVVCALQLEIDTLVAGLPKTVRQEIVREERVA